MKKAVLVFLAGALFSCSAKEENPTTNILENLSYTVDTVVVNSGDEVISLNWGLRYAGFSQDHKTLYIKEFENPTVIEIDLERLEITRKLQFEKEGPDGIGGFHTGFQVLSDGNFLFAGFMGTVLSDPEGHKIRDIKFSNETIDSLTDDKAMHAHFELLATQDLSHFLSLPGNLFGGKWEFLAADFSGLRGKILPLPAMDIVSEMRVMMNQNNGAAGYIDRISLQDYSGKAVISSSATSDIYLYDYSEDSLELKTYSHALVPSKKTPKAKKEVSSMEELRNEVVKNLNQFGFEEFVFDPQTARFYRFGRVLLSKADPNSEPQSEEIAEVYLFAYDLDFDLLGETRIEGLTKVPQFPFFKDGKLWSYVNVEDELGFAVMDFGFLNQQ